jgi:two-component system, OmpR family, response regulator
MGSHIRTILVVEDEPITQEIVVRYLERAEYCVLAASCGEGALQILREKGGGIDWLLTDIQLPGVIDGWVVGAEFHLSYPLRPVIYTSAFSAGLSPCLAGGVYLPKPYSPAMVAEVIGHLSSQDPTRDFRTPADRLQELLDRYQRAA